MGPGTGQNPALVGTGAGTSIGTSAGTSVRTSVGTSAGTSIGARREELPHAKSSQAATAKTSSRPESPTGVDADRKRANEMVAPATPAGSTPMVAPPDALAAANATLFVATNTVQPAAVIKTAQPASPNLNALREGSFESASPTASPVAIAQRPGAATRAAQAVDQSGGAIEGVGGKPVSAARTVPREGADDDPATQDAADSGEAAVSANGPMLYPEHTLAAASTASVLPRASESSDGPTLAAQTEPSPAKIDSVAAALQSSQATAGADCAQPPALSASISLSRSAVQPATVRDRRESAASAVHVVAVQSSGAADPSLLARNPAAASGGLHPFNQTPSAAGATVAGSRETFAALDAEVAQGTPNWIHAGAQQAEAGFQDPALGWVGVRADLNAGGIHAAIVPGSAEAAESLSGHLAGLSAHLATQQIPVESLRMATGSESTGGLQADAGRHGEEQQRHGQGPGQAPEQGSSSTATQSDGLSVAQSGARNPQGQAERLQPEQRPAESTLPGSATTGMHISVLA